MMERSDRSCPEWCVSQMSSGLKLRSCSTREQIGRSSARIFSTRFRLCKQLFLSHRISPVLADGLTQSLSKLPSALLRMMAAPSAYGETFHVFVESGSADMSVLGRDVTNNFGIIYDYPNQTVALLSPPHYYEIKKAS
jgi:hypothetical protein